MIYLLKKLPKAFENALSVTSRLEYDFIGIDSTRTIQDLKQHWTLELARMGSVYKNSTYTLAATEFPNGSNGLYSTREPTLVWPFKLKVFTSSSPLNTASLPSLLSNVALSKTVPHVLL
jgi:hypothetical protein